jgi:photosystem II stability/assembly factor-like uncharacterized protein
VTVSDGEAYTIWGSTDHGGTWSAVPMPVAQPAGPDRAAVVFGDGGRWMYLADDGHAGRIWVADLNR